MWKPTNKARRIVVAKRLGVAKGLKHRVALKKHVLDLINFSALAAHESNVSEEEMEMD
jgi:hypothetical protein